MSNEKRQQWRDAWIDSRQRLEEIRAFMRRVCELPTPSDAIEASPLEFQSLFRICQRIYGHTNANHDHVPFLIMRVHWYERDGELPDFVLRAHEMMQEDETLFRPELRCVYRFAVEHSSATICEGMDDESFLQKVGEKIASSALAGNPLYAP